MSYDIELINPETKEVMILDEKHDIQGGTYQVGGTDRAELNITYNYSSYFNKVLGEKGIRTIYGMVAEDSIPLLTHAIEQLDDKISEDYWESTEGNARCALEKLILLAKLCPDGVWSGD